MCKWVARVLEVRREPPAPVSGHTKESVLFQVRLFSRKTHQDHGTEQEKEIREMHLDTMGRERRNDGATHLLL